MASLHDSRVLRVLHIEDSELDHELAMAHLRRSGVQAMTVRLDSENQYRAALEDDWDVILSDFNLPGFTGLHALEILRKSGKLVPFILVSGEIGEDTAVEAMRNGASDYLLKNNLVRLGPAMEHAIAAYEALRARRMADEALAESKQRLSELAQHLQVRIEEERAAIAREIHDDVGGSLTALNFELAWIARHSTSAEVQQRVQSAVETVTHALEVSQRIMHNLRPAILEQGLVAALQWMAGRFERRTGVECAFRTSHDSLQLPAGVPLVAYRTAQEALTNVSKHAQARRVTIDLSVVAKVLLLEISDDGRGLSGADLAKARSFGIRGLHERASTVGGWVELTRATVGTSLILTIPLSDSLRLADFGATEGEHDSTAWGAS